MTFKEKLSFTEMIVDGLSGWDNKITLRKEIFENFERVIEVIFHELAHILTFEIMRETPLELKLKEIYGITDERIKSWKNGI